MLDLEKSLKTNYLSQLLPYDTTSKKNGDLRTGLIEYRMLLEALKSTIGAFKNNNLEKFDALVGENACQIRAVWVAKMAQNQSIDMDALSQQVVKAQQNLDNVLDHSISKLMLNGTTLDKVLVDENLEVSLEKEEMFLLEAHLLTIARGTGAGALCIRRVADPKNLKQFGDVSSTFTRNLLHILRKNISQQSVEFIRDNAVVLQNESCIKMSSEEFTIRHNSAFCIPMFWTYQVVLNAAKKAKIPLILHVKFISDPEQQCHADVEREYLFFKSEGNTQECRYVQHALTEGDLNQAAFVVQGICVRNDKSHSKEQWKASIKEYYIENIILAGAADHRQYPEVSQDHLVEKMNDELYNNYKEMALKEGFALENPTKFFIQHVYASQIALLPKVMNCVSKGMLALA